MAYVVKNEGSWVLFTKSNYLLNRALLNRGLGVRVFSKNFTLGIAPCPLMALFGGLWPIVIMMVLSTVQPKKSVTKMV